MRFTIRLNYFLLHCSLCIWKIHQLTEINVETHKRKSVKYQNEWIRCTICVMRTNGNQYPVLYDRISNGAAAAEKRSELQMYGKELVRKIVKHQHHIVFEVISSLASYARECVYCFKNIDIGFTLVIQLLLTYAQWQWKAFSVNTNV